MEPQNALESQNGPEQKEQCCRITITMLQSHSNKNNIVLTQNKTCRLIEQKSKSQAFIQVIKIGQRCKKICW